MKQWVGGRVGWWQVPGTCGDKDCPVPVSELKIWCDEHYLAFLVRRHGKGPSLAERAAVVKMEINLWLDRMLSRHHAREATREAGFE